MPDAIYKWLKSSCNAIKQLLPQIDKKQVEAVCLTHQRETFVAVDSEGKAVRNAIVWMDKRSRKQVSFLAEKIGPEHINQLTGKPNAMTPSLPKIILPVNFPLIAVSIEWNKC